MTTPTAPDAQRPPAVTAPSTRWGSPGGSRPRSRVLPAQARQHNRAAVLAVLFHEGPASRADLARSTGLTRVSVSEIVGDLLADELVEELGVRLEGRVGKPATMVGLRSTQHQVVAVDLERLSEVRGAVLDLTGAVVAERTTDLHGLRGAAAVEALQRFCREVQDLADGTVLGAGIGTPGVVDAAGRVVEASNLGWTDVPLAELLTAALGVGVHVENDANAAALAEFTYGAASSAGFMAVTVGEGVGAGIVLDGRLVRGHRLAAGEIGHLTVDPSGPRCECGRRGCLELSLAVRHLTAALDGRTAARRRTVLAAAGRRLGTVLAPVVAALDLEEVLLSGPPELLDGPLLDAARDTIRELCFPAPGAAPRLRMTALHDLAVLQGAAALVLAGELGFS